MVGRWTWTLVCAAMLAATLTGAEKPPELYSRNMLDTNAAVQSLTRTIPAKDYGKIAQDAIVLRRLFATTLAFWEPRSTTDAIEYAKAGASAADALASAAYAKDDSAIASAVKAVNYTC
jgi:hypothetical protein